MIFHSEYCQEHTYRKNGKEIVNPIQKMVIGGHVVCPRCELEKEHQALTNEVQAYYDGFQSQKIYNIFIDKSIITDQTILNASFENYETSIQEERLNKSTCIEIAERLKSGQVFNPFLQGIQGTGKSHLAYSILKRINDAKLNKSCLFINVEDMMRKIKDSFSNRQSKYTERYFVNLLSSVDFLALDDVGAETGAIDTDKTASDFVQRILYAITSTRQDKATILTTNLSSEVLFNMYDKKVVSRLLKNPKYVLFKETKDKRLASIPF
ncbi:DnaA ATPase domain-containing protein [Heyndrickxia oleronia]|uniref:DnaA/Hda family protein n=1 Tax=Heyndrickxia oleronia TaxID=38875 RepID=A0AAW6SQD0_9BACI|nr:DnaA/Hda family protein [Heyndrickxia oleronia]MDH5160490.1 DnaA/Hda family protein [Heyndrickxia oleronia]